MALNEADSWRFCLGILPRVSRTFALNIRVLRGSLHRSVLLGYLVCRILDTVEDSPSLDHRSKARLLREWLAVKDARAGALWGKRALECGLDGTPAELELVGGISDVLSCFYGLPEEYRGVGEKMFSTMAAGMAEFIERFPSGRVVLDDVQDLRNYCYYVAGVVGEFLCELFLKAYKIDERRRRILRDNCVAFGLGLQMTNIAKDILKDHRRGQRFFPGLFLRQEGVGEGSFLTGENPKGMWAAYGHLLAEARAQLMGAYAFTMALPLRCLRLRLFCLRPLWMAFETLKVLSARPGLLQSEMDVKINRAQVKKILWTTNMIAPSNWLVKSSFMRNYQRDGFDTQAWACNGKRHG